MRTAYRSYYRTMLIRLLDTLKFRSGDDIHRPVLAALAIVENYAGSRLQVFPFKESVSINGIVSGLFWRLSWSKRERGRIDCLAYDVCVLLALRGRLRSKEIWVGRANRYNNPEGDLPKDFERERPYLPCRPQAGLERRQLH